ncbi:hypothetical protein [Pedobacter punctiformis]|uniref:DUF4468 domain-containing protein n=1 Tax=Pedobacter punctiformis TaxID=3004097 RepID=A0ABT4L771_9SPHI|nr:hypothetical protein [Pedobacter sp. HCMS5-2]MCZ4243773.1 hypothetical protein [Pedobacter sp. HCMS5-2]
MNRFLCLFVLVCSAKFSFSQIKNDYVITSKGDTIRCEIKEEIFGAIKYKAEGSDRYIKVKPKEIKEYFYSKYEHPYVSIIFPNGYSTFLERLETGKINLYQQLRTSTMMSGKTAMVSSTTDIQWYAEKGESGFKLIKTNHIINISNSKKDRKATLNEFIADNTALSAQFKDADTYAFNEIRKIIKTYNEQALK